MKSRLTLFYVAWLAGGAVAGIVAGHLGLYTIHDAAPHPLDDLFFGFGGGFLAGLAYEIWLRPR